MDGWLFRSWILQYSPISHSTPPEHLSYRFLLLDSCYLDVFQKHFSSGLSSQWGKANENIFSSAHSWFYFADFNRSETGDRLQFIFSLKTIFCITAVSWHIILSLIMLASNTTVLYANEVDIAVTIYPAQPKVLRLYWPEPCASKFTTLSHSLSHHQTNTISLAITVFDQK